MKSTLCLVVVLSCALTASAVDGRLFITSWDEGYGWTDPSVACTATHSEVDLDGNNYNAKDYYYGYGPYVVDSYPPADHPGHPMDSPLELFTFDGSGAYLWLQFDESAPKGMNINGLQIEVKEASTGLLADGFAPVTYYLANDIGAYPGRKRWDGPATAPDYPEFSGNNPQVLVAVTAYGLKKTFPPTPDQYFSGQAGGNIALLGSICLNDLDPINYFYIEITDINLTEGETSADDWLAHTYFGVDIPEPASVLLLGLAGLVLRRRS
jgi:hypothetical protein